MDKKGIIVSILQAKGEGNSSNDGLSARHQKALLVGENILKVFEASLDLPAVTIQVKLVYERRYYYAVPLDEDGEPLDKRFRVMNGGCFIWSSDSRFPFRYPIPLHDRLEP